MTDDEVRAARERAEAATPGPWTFETFPNGLYEGVPGPSYDVAHGDPADARDRYSVLEDLNAANAVFIAAARTDVPLLAGEVDFLRGLLRDCQEDGRDVAALEASRRENEVMREALVQTAEGTFGLWGDRARAVLDRLGVAYREPEAASPGDRAMAEHRERIEELVAVTRVAGGRTVEEFRDRATALEANRAD